MALQLLSLRTELTWDLICDLPVGGRCVFHQRYFCLFMSGLVISCQSSRSTFSRSANLFPLNLCFTVPSPKQSFHLEQNQHVQLGHMYPDTLHSCSSEF